MDCPTWMKLTAACAMLGVPEALAREYVADSVRLLSDAEMLGLASDPQLLRADFALWLLAGGDR